MKNLSANSNRLAVKNDRFVRANIVDTILQNLAAENSPDTSKSKMRTSKEVLMLVIEAYVDCEDFTVSDIHLMLEISRSTAGRAIRALETWGAIRRTPDPHDRRRQILTLTPASSVVVDGILSEIDATSTLVADTMNVGQFTEESSADDYAFVESDDEVDTGTTTPDIDATIRLLMYQHGSRLSGTGHLIWEPVEDKCLFASREAASLFGLSVEDFLKASNSTNGFVGLLQPMERRRIYRFIEHFRTGHTKNEVTYRLVGEDRAAGRYLLHTLDRLPLPDEDRGLELHVLEDITKQIKSVVLLNEAKKEAERSNQLRGEFISHFSHELRTPLNAIIGFSQMLESEMLGPHMNEKYSEYSKDIYHSGLHLLDIINDVLDLSKLEAGRMNIDAEPLDLDSVIGSCTRMITRQAHDNRVVIRTEVKQCLPKLIADELRIRQILINLLSNAVKFTDPDGHIDITAECDSSGAILIEIRDSGVGIPPDELENVLQPFGQVPNKSGGRPVQGTGLGLTLVKFLAELHDAEFSLDSEIDQGTVAVLRFPPERTDMRQ
jgi:signal transduction histidine kinase